MGQNVLLIKPKTIDQMLYDHVFDSDFLDMRPEGLATQGRSKYK